MIRFTIDGRSVEVPEGKTILDAARILDIDIPTLCYLERCGPMTSCLVCVVRVTISGRTSVMPSCAVKAVEGMQVESETAEVHELRRSALELLLSDHVGDCLSPCARICPLGLNIPQMLRQVQMNQLTEAMATVRVALALPAVLGRLCHKPCENGCRRAACDSAAAIQDVERFVADFGQSRARPYLPPRQPTSGKQVAVVGSGPAGLAAAYELVRQGHHCVVFDRQTEAGGALRREVHSGSMTREVLDRELEELEQFGVEFRLGVEVGTGRTVDLSQLRDGFAAVLLAVGELKPGEGEILQVPLTGAGVKIVRADAFLSGVDRVFAAGSAVRPIKQLVKAMSEGQAAAAAIAEHLAGREARKAAKPFSSLMGRLEATEIKLFQERVHPGPRVSAGKGKSCGYSPAEAAEESSRCLHCDCRAAGDCRLQHYSQVYGAEFGRFPRQRRSFEQQQHPARVLFEPGKCILCGICVHLASEAAEPLGLTFVGRGFDVRVAAPLNEEFDQGLRRVAVECAAACPTGAIAIAAPTDRLGVDGPVVDGSPLLPDE